MTEQQIKWASQHDWFLSAGSSDVQVLEIVVAPDRSVTETVRIFSDFKALRRWAGY